MKKLVLIVAAFAIVGCKDFTGQMTVSKSFEATSIGFFGKETKLVLAPGYYDTELKGTMGGDLSMSFKLNDKKQKIKLNIPKRALPKDNGSFEIKAADLEQPFDLRGEVKTVASRTANRRMLESCGNTRTFTHCYYSDVEGRDICGTTTETTHGQREVEFHHNITTTTVSVEVINPSFPSEVAATLQGRNEKSEHVYDYQGICH